MTLNHSSQSLFIKKANSMLTDICVLNYWTMGDECDTAT